MRFLQSPETFTVEELPLFKASGRGGHCYVTLRRKGISTPHLLREMCKILELKEAEIGCAGNKDRDAVTVQTLSFPAGIRERIEPAVASLGAEILSLDLHEHKLRAGKLAGNRFTAKVELDDPSELDILAKAVREMASRGMANAFGPQRFGDGDAVEKGRLLFLGLRPYGAFRSARFAISVFQSAIFNQVLTMRRERGLLPGPLSGDLMKKHDPGGEFVAPDDDDNTLWRVEAMEISPTGPMPGRKMPWPEGRALDLELEALASRGLSQMAVSASKVPGARRFLRVPTGPIEVRPAESSAVLSFALPPGSYASVLLAELGVEIVPPAREPRGK
jgi:tRNA pseudouridine13 synthase